ncbi:MAG: 2-isopropylmalate synthase, partial [Candidatus Electrothrix sp. AR3]|nr:2-isopropylmalate synthase [Candidatus Electrothrix sp. AR3]
KETEKVGKDLVNQEVYNAFEREYLGQCGRCRLKQFNVVKRHIDQSEQSNAAVEAVVEIDGKEQVLRASGNGPLDAFCAALKNDTDLEFILNDYHEHALTEGSS